MRRLKIISKLIDFAKVRPLFVMVAAVVLIDTIYVNLWFRWPAVQGAGAGQRQTAENQGKVIDRAFDENGNLKSITVGKAICYVNNGEPDFNPPLDSTLKVSGSIKTIEGPMNPGEFNRKTYYGARRIFYEMNADSVELIKAPKIGVREWFYKVRRNFSERILEYFPLEGGTVNTLICADKSELSKERKELYTRVGVGHFLVISGLHISAVGTFIYKLLRRFGLKVRTGCVTAMAFLILYGLLVGFSVSVIRAVLMFCVRLMADVLKRTYDMLNAVALAELINIIINPMCIIDSAFIYSYSTVLSISVYITNRPKQSTKAKDIRSKVRETLKFSGILWLFIMPVNLYISYGCSLVSVVANTMLAPLSVPILIIAFAGFLFSLSGTHFLAGIADFFIAVILRGFDKLCKLIAAIPLFTFNGKPALWKLVIYYVLLLWLIHEGDKHLGKLLRVGVIAGMILFATVPADLTGRVTTLYVGQGECVVIHTGVKSAVVYDCGSTSKTGVGEYILVPYLKATGVSRVEGIFVSHGDLDHAGEVAYLCEKLPQEGITLEHLYVQDIPKESKSKCLLEAESTAARNGIPVTKLSKGQRIIKGAYSFTCLWPVRGSEPADANAGSMVILASLNGFDTLLTGDATGETERQIMNNAKRVSKGPLELLLVSHHGSDSASDSEFLKCINPSTAVVSAGINNRYGHPHKEVLNRFRTLCPETNLLRTDRSGAVSVEFKNQKFSIFPYLK
ncbi:MAG: DNA internalization-related competence protein ComEC/Rec2 [Lachnospiraceae bacterium]|nr:DNA internalization-related competence protein ComEC/Rec2 [Lachnospiraceae bacterium]